MLLHIYIAGRQRFEANVAPGQVQQTLQMVNDRMPTIALQGRIAVTLDSDTHPNVTYLLNRHSQEN